MAKRQSIDHFRRSPDGSRVLLPIGKGAELVLDALDYQCPISAIGEDLEIDQWIPK